LSVGIIICISAHKLSPVYLNFCSTASYCGPGHIYICMYICILNLWLLF